MVGGHNCSGYTPGAAIGNAFTAVTEKATVAAGGSGFMDRNNIDAMNAVTMQSAEVVSSHSTMVLPP